MDGVGIEIDITELTAAISMVSRLGALEMDDLSASIAMLGESQTRRRIEEEKTAPDGTPWKPNAEGTSILLRTGQHLRDSVASSSSGATAEWGASWEHAHVHQFGATIVPRNAELLVFKIGGKKMAAPKVVIPARPFAGLSDENKQEMRDLVTDYLGGLFH